MMKQYLLVTLGYFVIGVPEGDQSSKAEELLVFYYQETGFSMIGEDFW